MSKHRSSTTTSQHTSVAPPQIIRRSDKVHLSAGQCDCACAEVINPSPPFLTPFDHTALYIPSQSLPAHKLSSTYQAALSPYGVAVLNQSAFQLMAAFVGGRTPQEVLAHLPMDWPAEVTHTTLQEMVSLGLISPLGTQPQIHPETLTTLTAWLHVTSACNLRCAYCYLEPTPAEMSPQVGRQAVEAVFRSALAHNFPAVKLKYAGGEPTLCFSLVVELHRHATDLAAQYGLELDGVVPVSYTHLTLPTIYSV